MSQIHSPTEPRARRGRTGRPRSGTRPDIPQLLLRAAEKALYAKSYGDITAREIAECAGTNHAMIKYYFDGKEGLFTYLVDLELTNITKSLDSLRARIPKSGSSATRDLISTLCYHYFNRAPLYKLVIDELRNGASPLRNHFVTRGQQTFQRVVAIIEDLKRAGVYRADLDVQYAGFLVTCVINTPVTLFPVLSRIGPDAEAISDWPYMDNISQMLHREFSS